MKKVGMTCWKNISDATPLITTQIKSKRRLTSVQTIAASTFGLCRSNSISGPAPNISTAMIAGRTVTGTKRSVFLNRSDISNFPAKPITQNRIAKVAAAIARVIRIKVVVFIVMPLHVLESLGHFVSLLVPLVQSIGPYGSLRTPQQRQQ